jgi:hypothetical protein
MVFLSEILRSHYRQQTFLAAARGLSMAKVKAATKTLHPSLCGKSKLSLRNKRIVYVLHPANNDICVCFLNLRLHCNSVATSSATERISADRLVRHSSRLLMSELIYEPWGKKIMTPFWLKTVGLPTTPKSGLPPRGGRKLFIKVSSPNKNHYVNKSAITISWELEYSKFFNSIQLQELSFINK